MSASVSGSRIKLIVCDLDNTLYDWVSFFVPSLYLMIDQAVGIMSCDKEQLLDDLKNIHQHYHNSEHPYSLLETRTYKNWALEHGDSARELIDPAFHAFNSSRKRLLQLYPTVFATLDIIRNAKVAIVAYSDSGFYAVLDRVKRLGIHGKFDRIYCSPRADESYSQVRSSDHWLDDKIIELPPNGKKPSTSILKRICSNQGVAPSQAMYVGDSLVKDIWMASQAGLISVWAKYGTTFDRDLYQKLVRISHWTPEDIQREADYSTAAGEVSPDFICENSFSEILKEPHFFSASEMSRQHSAA